MTWDERCLNQDDMRWVVAVLQKAVKEGGTVAGQDHLRQWVKLLGKGVEKEIKRNAEGKWKRRTRFLFDFIGI